MARLSAEIPPLELQHVPPDVLEVNSWGKACGLDLSPLESIVLGAHSLCCSEPLCQTHRHPDGTRIKSNLLHPTSMIATGLLLRPCKHCYLMVDKQP